MRVIPSLLTLCLAATAALVAAQDPGDLVSSTRANGIIITGSIDEDGDTVGLDTLTDANGDPITATLLATTTAAVITTPLATTTTTQAQAAVSIEEEAHDQVSDQNKAAKKVDDVVYTPSADHYRVDEQDYSDVNFHIQHRRSEPTPQPELYRRQQGGAALGGGVVASSTSSVGLQSISGYTPPATTSPPAPDNISSGTILSPSDIPGYESDGKGDGTTGTSGALNITPYSSSVILLIGATISLFYL